MREHGLTVSYPQFVADQIDAEKVLSHLKERAPHGIDKFAFVEWVAKELTKRESFMSVPMLCMLLNDLDYRTNTGMVYSGKRGAYKLVSGTYHRLFSQDEKRARMVATTFRRPHFEYAYPL